MSLPIGRSPRPSAARVALVLLASGIALGADDPKPPAASSSSISRRAVDPAAPALPGPVVAAMQGGKYDEAIVGLDRLVRDAADPATRSYLALIRGTADRLAGRPDAARSAWAAALAADPRGPWSSKVRLELAGLELAAGHPDRAEAFAREVAVSLLAGDRKDRLAGVYLAFARRLLRPDDPVTPADPNGAYALLDQARGLAKGGALVASLRLEMARASQAAKNFPRAINDYTAYAETPNVPERPTARFAVGECQLATGNVAAARLVWSDLADELDKAPGRSRPDAAEIRAKALYLIAKTHGIPAPPDDGALALGVAAIGRFLAAYPDHPWAGRAAYEVGAAYLARGKSDQGLAALVGFLGFDEKRATTDEARRELAALKMTATFQVGEVLQGQAKFPEAIAAWEGYLSRYPNGPQSADARRSILDARLSDAAESLRLGKFADARAAWAAFVAQNPLDARVPQILFDSGESYVTEEKYDRAIEEWSILLSRFPGSEPAAHAQFLIASIFEERKADLAGAIERFKKVAVEPWQATARQRIAVMESRELTVVTPRAFRSGETPHLKISTRNLDALTFTAYRLNAEAYFRKKGELGSVESLDVGLVAADAEWTVPVPGYGKYRPVETLYPLKVGAPGVWVVRVTDGEHLQATTLVLGSDLDAIVKASRDQLVVFAQDMKTGQGRPKARVIVSDGSGVIFEGATGADGVLLASWEKPRDPASSLRYLVLDGKDAAGTGLGLPAQVARGLSARAYLYTDRPAYRPGQTVQIRGIVREAVDGRYATPTGGPYRLEVADSRGRLLVDRPVAISGFGTFHATVGIDDAAPVGSYRVRLHRPGKADFAGAFEVQSYHLEPIDLTFDLPRTVYFRGETVTADLVARYPYGSPVANRPVEVALPDGRTVRGATDAAGKFRVEFSTRGFAEEQSIRIVGRLPQDNVAAAADVSVAIRAFGINLSTTRDTYLDGESFAVKAATVDAQGKPTGQALTLAVIKRVNVGGRITERRVSEVQVATDPTTGEGSASIRVDDADGGAFVVRASGTDRFGNAVVDDRALYISGKQDETKLRILADRQTFKVGETAAVVVHGRAPAGPALVSWEADRVLQYRLVDLKEGENPLTWAVETAQSPNFTLTAARMVEGRLDEARLDVKVERDLRVTIRPARPTVGPGEDVAVEVTTTDQMGRPVAAELSLALVDKSLLRLYGDATPPIGPFFYDQSRTGAFATSASNTFRYDPETMPVSEAVVEEEARQAALAENGKRLESIRRQAGFRDEPGRGGGAGGDSILAYSFMGRAGRSAGKAAPAPMPEPNRPAAPGMMSGDSPRLEQAQEKPKGAIQDTKEKVPGGDAFESLTRTRRRLYASGPGEESRLLDRESRYANVRSRGVNGAFDLEIDADGAQQEPHRRSAETAYWNPSVVTGADGKATIKVKAPAALADYRLTARGVTGSDTLVGQATADLVVSKDFFVDLRTPDALGQGDRPRFLARVHHRGVAGPVALTLTVYAGGRQEVFPKTLAIRGDGVDEAIFDPFEVPEGETVRLTVRAEAGGKSDELTVEVPVRPRGVQAFASASGTSSDNATVFVGLPPGRTYDNPDMLVTIAPTLRRLIVELALGDDARPYSHHMKRLAPCPPLPLTIADRAGELIAASAALEYLRSTKADAAPEAERLVSRVRGLTAELITVQNDDGGWPWVAPSGAGDRKAKAPSDRMTSALAARAFAAARSQAMMTDPAALDRAANYLAAEAGRVEAGDLEMKATVQHALASLGRGGFEAANALGRSRQSLPDAALAELALSLAALDRIGLAGELLDLLAARARSEPVGPGEKPRTYWAGDRQHWRRGPAETTAVVALAFARVRPGAKETAGAAEWLLAHRSGSGWQPHKAKGDALSALARTFGPGRSADDRYRLVITVNDAEVYRADVTGPAEGKAVLVPRRAIKLGDRNRVRFEVEGRGTFGYSVTLTGFARDLGPEQDAAGKPFVVDARDFFPAVPELDGKPLPTGFGVAVGAKPFINRVTKVGLGGRARVEIRTALRDRPDRPSWEREFLIVEETLPAGATFIDGSLESRSVNHTLADGVLTLYYAPGQPVGSIHYDVFGAIPGRYAAPPTRIRSAYEPGRQHLGPATDLRVLAPGEPADDPYRATPDELYARGKRQFDAGRLAEAAAPLEELAGAYTLRDDIAREAARMLLTVHVRDYQPRKVVQDFEVLKEKAPDLIIPFDDVAVVARAYRDIGEHERSYLVWRAIVEASYLEDAQVGEALRRRGRTLDAVAYLLDLWREYPNTASIEADLFGVAQVVSVAAGKAIADPALRKELADAGVTRSELVLQAIRLGQALLAQSPVNPLADEVSLAQVGDLLELEDYEAVVGLSGRYARLYPKSPFLDSFQYSEALGRFHLGQYDRAIEVAEGISNATYKDAAGVEQPSPNKWQAIYILGQIHDARRQPAKAVEFYRQVADRFSDAAGAIRALTRKDLSLPEITVVRPRPKAPAAGGGVAPGAVAAAPAARPGLALGYRNVAEADVKVYPVDLMRLYLSRRNLDAIAGVDLAGITPRHESAVPLGDGLDFADKSRPLDLPLDDEGAYLVMARGGNLYASGIVLVSPLELEVLEEADAGRVRVTVRDAGTKDPAPGVTVKVIGTDNPAFLTGRTDLRGVFVADGVRGEVTAVARRGAAQYAFHRGKTYVGPRKADDPNAKAPADPGKPAAGEASPEPSSDLGFNVKMLNSSNQVRQLDRLENRYKGGRQGIKAQEAR